MTDKLTDKLVHTFQSSGYQHLVNLREIQFLQPDSFQSSVNVLSSALLSEPLSGGDVFTVDDSFIILVYDLVLYFVELCPESEVLREVARFCN